MFYQIFLSPQVKHIAIISDKYTICFINFRKIEIELFTLCANSHGNLSLSQIFCPSFLCKRIFASNSPQALLNLICFTILEI